MSEQERADQVSREIDRLLAGAPVAGDGMLLESARLLASMPLQPSLMAQQRFEQRLAEWFGPPSPPPARWKSVPRNVVTTVLWIGVGAILGFILAAAVSRREATPTASPTMTVVPSVTPGITSTATAVLTQVVSPTGTSVATTEAPTVATSQVIAPPTPTPLTFVKILVSGPIDSIQGSMIVVLGQSISLTGGVTGLCVGDMIQLEATYQAGIFSADRGDVKVQSSACSPTNSIIIQPGGGNGGGSSGGSGSNGGSKPGGDDDDHHKG